MIAALAIVRAALADVPARVLLFGSWARGEGRRHSDIDVAILPERPLPAGTLGRIRSLLEESRVLRVVDLVDLSVADDAFRARVLAEATQ